MAAEEVVVVVVVVLLLIVVNVVVVTSLSILNNVLGCTELKKYEQKMFISLSNVSDIHSIEAVLDRASTKIPGLLYKID